MQVWSTTSGNPQTIDAAILAHRIRATARLGGAEFAAGLGVARTRVRRAVMRLPAGRIVEERPRGGWFVVAPCARQAREIFRLAASWRAG